MVNIVTKDSRGRERVSKIEESIKGLVVIVGLGEDAVGWKMGKKEKRKWPQRIVCGMVVFMCP